MAKLSLKERQSGAIWGQFVGDAVALGAHHIECPNEIKERFPEGIQGFEAPHKKHVHANKAPGGFTYYGDAALVFLQSMAQQQRFSIRDFGTLFIETFAAPDYPNAINKTTRETIENYHLSLEEGHPDLGYEFQGGANTTDIDSATRLAPLIALHWEDSNLLPLVDLATRVTQNNEITVAYMRSYARILRSLFQGEALRKILFNETHPAGNDTPLDRHVREHISFAFELEPQNTIDAARELGISSHLDQSYPAAIHACLKHENFFESGILETIRAGGDGAGRAALVGTWLGGNLGLQGIPKEWKNRLTHSKEIESAIEKTLNL